MPKLFSRKPNRFLAILILIFFMGSVFFSTAVPSWCIEVDNPNVVIKGHLHLFKCHASTDVASESGLIGDLSTVPCHGDDHCKLCFDIPISTANAFHNPGNFKKEIGDIIIFEADYWQPIFYIPTQYITGRTFKYDFNAYLPNPLLQVIRTVVLLN